MKLVYNKTLPNEGTQLARCAKARKVAGDEMRLMGKWLNDGIDQAEYDTLSDAAKNISAYKPQLTEPEFRSYQSTVYWPRSDALSLVVSEGEGRAQADAAKFHSVNLNTDFDEV